MATSLATLYLSYGINHAPKTGSSLFFPLETAQYYLSVLEPIQIGYGAVVSIIKKIPVVQATFQLIFPRSSPSSEQSTGVSSTPSTADTNPATAASPSAAPCPP